MSRFKSTEQIVESWGLRRQILELLMLDIRYFGMDENNEYIPQTKLAPEIVRFLKNYPIGGILLFRENLDTPEQIVRLTHELQQNVEVGRFIAVDQEGGVVTRSGTDTPGNMALGVINDLAATTMSANMIAREISALGINLNFAPVLDVNSNPDNPIIGVRAFGDDPELVAKHGIAFINGLHEENIIACAKHFPGHGDTATDSHLGTAYVKKGWAQLEQIELLPFKQVIDKINVECIMVAHLIVPALDDTLLFSEKTQTAVATPATLSKTILTDLLRNKMQFSGLIITDAMDMQAISDNFNPVEATIYSLKAGADIIVMPVKIWKNTDLANFADYFTQIYKACLADNDLCLRVRESCLRIIELKLKCLKGIDSQFTVENNKVCVGNDRAGLLEEKIKKAKLIVGGKEHIEYQNLLSKRAITIHRNSQNHLPFKLNEDDNLLVIGSSEKLLATATNCINNIITHYNEIRTPQSLPRINFDNVKTWILDYTKLDQNMQFSCLKKFDKIIVLTYNLGAKDENIDLLFKELNTLKIPYVMLSCRNPYDIKYATLATTNVLVYGASGFDQTGYKIKDFSLNLHNALQLILT